MAITPALRLALPALLLSLGACRNADKGDDGEIGYDPDAPVDADGDGYTDDEDCDDSDSAVFPGAEERCNDVDDDCDGDTDEGLLDTWYTDADGDGQGDPTTGEIGCEPGPEQVANDSDCDDTDADTFLDAPERCDEIDNDCDGQIDEDVETDWYADADDDGFGDEDSTLESCDPPAGWVAEAAEGFDCDDLDATSYPGAEEVCDEADNDCDGEVDEGVELTFYTDADGDGFGDALSPVEACEEPVGAASDSEDCDDTDPAVNPDADEICNEIDDDCDGTVDEDDALDAATWYADTDGDGYGDADSTTTACEQPSGYVDDDQDCDDGSAGTNPDGTELCDGVDNDCDGTVDEDDALDAATWYEDDDGDSYGDASSSTVSCSQPTGYVADATDCDDTESAANPGETEVCDELDNDCDGDVDEGVESTWYLDYDGDGYGDDSETESACSAPTSKYVSVGGDCDDTDTAYSPAASEGCDGEDYDCDGDVDNDADGDGYADESCGGDDCDDSDASIYPEQTGECALGASCQAILDAGYSTGDGTYTIDVDGYGTGDDPEEVYCDMSTESGGWTRVALNADSGTWNSSTVVNDTTFGSVSDTTSDYKAEAYHNLVFVDVMFDDGTDYAVYEGVGDDTTSWLDFMDAIAQPNCSSSSGYYYAMTAGTFGGGDLCNTNLYIHPIDMDGGSNSSCSATYVWANNATGPAWSRANNNGCPLDDPSSSSFISYGTDVPWSTSDPLMIYVR